jgi:hypothetical protein
VASSAGVVEELRLDRNGIRALGKSREHYTLAFVNHRDIVISNKRHDFIADEIL